MNLGRRVCHLKRLVSLRDASVWAHKYSDYSSCSFALFPQRAEWLDRKWTKSIHVSWVRTKTYAEIVYRGRPCGESQLSKTMIWRRSGMGAEIWSRAFYVFLLLTEKCYRAWMTFLRGVIVRNSQTEKRPCKAQFLILSAWTCRTTTKLPLLDRKKATTVTEMILEESSSDLEASARLLQRSERLVSLFVSKLLPWNARFSCLSVATWSTPSHCLHFNLLFYHIHYSQQLDWYFYCFIFRNVHSRILLYRYVWQGYIQSDDIRANMQVQAIA